MIRLKNEAQIAGIRASCHLLADLFNEILPKIKAGLTTAQVDHMCHAFMSAHGGSPAWYKEDFPGAICISINDEVIHGVPDKKRVIRDGDLVSLDIGIDLNGFISDSTHSVIVGAASEEKKKLHEVTKECLEAGIAACVAGNRIKDIAQAVFDRATKEHYGVVTEYCGHGVGLEVHEDPSVPNTPTHCPNHKLQAGMVIAIEPMINAGGAAIFVDKNGWTVKTLDGRPSCHEEHTVAIFADHTEVLTALDYKDKQ